MSLILPLNLLICEVNCHKWQMNLQLLSCIQLICSHLQIVKETGSSFCSRQFLMYLTNFNNSKSEGE